MKSLHISFDDISVIEKQKLLKSPVFKFLINFITFVIFSIVFSVTHNYVLVGIILLIEIVILWILERPGGLRVRRQ